MWGIAARSVPQVNAPDQFISMELTVVTAVFNNHILSLKNFRVQWNPQKFVTWIIFNKNNFLTTELVVWSLSIELLLP